jgi:hypothetical protein
LSLMVVPADDEQGRGAPPQTVGGPKRGAAVTRADVLLVALFILAGAGVSFLADRGLAWLAKGLEPREERTRLRYDVQWKRDGLAMTRKELAATEDQLIRARLDLSNQEATLGALDAVPPPPPTPAQGVQTKADEAQQGATRRDGAAPLPTRAETLVRREAAARRVNSLVARLDALQQSANALRREADEAERLVAYDFGFWHVAYKAARGAVTLALTLIVLWVFYKLARPLVSRYDARAAAAGRVRDSLFLLKVVVAAVLILVAYQTFQVAGAALAGAVVLLLFLADMPWPSKPEAAGGQSS